MNQPITLANNLNAQRHALLDAQSTPALLSSAAGNIIWANPAAQALFNVGLKQLVGASLAHWLSQANHSNHDNKEDFLSVLTQIAQTLGQPVKFDVRLKESQALLQAIISPIENELTQHDEHKSLANHVSNSIIAVELVNHTPVLLLQATEHRAAQQTAQRELLRNLAHEIRNPLGGIRGAAQLLARELKHSSQKEYTDVIVAEATRLQTLLDRLLSAQSAPRTLSYVNVHELLERVRSIVSAEYPAPLAWRRDYDVSLPDITVDEHQLVQVLMNLIRNAAQILMDSPQAEKTITLATRALRQITIAGIRHKLALELLVIDNGPGIPPALRPQLFNPLVSQRVGGTGLGLHIAQSFVQQHGGNIEVKSQAGRTVFTVVLPVNSIQK